MSQSGQTTACDRNAQLSCEVSSVFTLTPLSCLSLFTLCPSRLRGRVYSFADEHRPVPLKFHVYDYKVKRRK